MSPESSHRARAPLAVCFAVALCACTASLTTARDNHMDSRHTELNRATVHAAFARWSDGGGGPFDLLAEHARWTIVGSSPLSKTYRSRQQFLDEVIAPFNARLSAPLKPTVRAIHADRDTVIVLFDAEAIAKDGKPYRNTYAWCMQFVNRKITEVTAFLDTRLLDEFWTRITPASPS